MFLYTEEFVEFINLHADTLEEVTLIDLVFLSAEEWQKAIHCIENASLSRVRISTPLNIFTDGELSTIEDISRSNELLGGPSERIRAGQEESALLNRPRVQSSTNTINNSARIYNRRIPS